MNKEISERISQAFNFIDAARRVLEVIPNGDEDVLLYDALRALEMPAGEDFQNSVKRRLYEYLGCGPVEQAKPRTFVQDVWRAVEMIRGETLSHVEMLTVVQLVYDAGVTQGGDPTQGQDTLREFAQKMAAAAQRHDEGRTVVGTTDRPMNPVFDGAKFRDYREDRR